MTRTVVVTGGSRGIGAAVVARFAAAGDHVVAVGRDADALGRVVAAAAGSAVAEVCDVSDEAAVIQLFERLGDVDVLVNNAGVSTSAPVRRHSLADWRAQLEVNATGAFLCTRSVVAGMLERDRGRIIFVASVAGLAGAAYAAGYAASKHAMVGLMRTVAAEVAGTGVTANAVCPTYVDTEMTVRTVARISTVTGRSRGEAEGVLTRASPLGRLLEPDEVAFAVDFLAAPEAGAINGQTLTLDGGGLLR